MKHAFMIMAHTNYSQLDKLLKSLDSRSVDIFLHVDERSVEYHAPCLHHAGLYEIPRMKVTWGVFPDLM